MRRSAPSGALRFQVPPGVDALVYAATRLCGGSSRRIFLRQLFEKDVGVNPTYAPLEFHVTIT